MILLIFSPESLHQQVRDTVNGEIKGVSLLHRHFCGALGSPGCEGRLDILVHTVGCSEVAGIQLGMPEGVGWVGWNDRAGDAGPAPHPWTAREKHTRKAERAPGQQTATAPHPAVPAGDPAAAKTNQTHPHQGPPHKAHQGCPLPKVICTLHTQQVPWRGARRGTVQTELEGGQLPSHPGSPKAGAY